MRFYNQKAEKVLSELDVDPFKGLDELDVQSRREKHGTNELVPEKKTSKLLLFIRQFHSFIIYILLFAVVISIISGEYTDSVVILIILSFNALFGFIQEFKAEKAIHALRKISGLKAKVLRDGKIEMVNTKELVVGDIIFLEEGNKVPADARMIEQNAVMISEASLTGESIPVSKIVEPITGELLVQDQKNMLFSGTIVMSGRAKAVVTGIGMNTEIGKIADMITKVQPEVTPLQRKLEKLGRKIAIVTLIICLAVFLTGLIKEHILYMFLHHDINAFIDAFKSWLMTSVSLAVAAVPEGLPAVVTIALAIGVRKMVSRNALIRRLPSVETLGEATVICTDKTGTITKNEMTVRAAYTNLKHIFVEGEGYSKDGRMTSDDEELDKESKLLFKIGALCNNAFFADGGNKPEVSGDPTEIALLVSAEKAGLNTKNIRKTWKRVDEKPFDSVRKLMTTVNQDPNTGKEYVFVKGAPESVLSKCNRIIIKGNIRRLTSEDKEYILSKNEAFARKALRVLGFAYKEKNAYEDYEDQLIFVGLQGMIDPPHHEVKEAIQRCKEAGIRVIMITGDNKFTAEAIAREIGLETNSIDGEEFAGLSSRAKLKTIKEVSIFSRVEPRHKMGIVDLLQKHGEVVAMTGDGVNDAPAIKEADLGISMGITGSDVAKESSDMILMDDNFTTIVNSVEEGRGIYENIGKFVNYLLSCNIGEVFVIFIAILFGWPLPMTAIMLLWLNLITDGLPALALSVDPYPLNLMKKPPKKSAEGIMSKKMMIHIAYVSILISAAVLVLFFWAMTWYEGFPDYLSKIQTIAFTAIMMMELVRLQAIRFEYGLSMFSNKYLVGSVIVSIILQLLIIYTPINAFFGTTFLNFTDWLLIVFASLLVLTLDIFGRSLRDIIKISS